MLKLSKILMLSSTLILVGCGSNSHQDTHKITKNIHYNNTFVYESNSPYANALKECVLIAKKQDACTLAKLPLLGQEHEIITKEMIMQRLIVSHKWMGERFSQMLDLYSDKMIKQLFRATTAIVIDDDIIPAYYWAITGAIYLDPRYLWQTQEEKETITKLDDYRSGYSSGLLFNEATFYRKNGKSLYSQNKISRTAHEVELSFAGLLYHELTHANDFIPMSMLSSLNNELTVYQNIINVGKSRTSDQLYINSPLQSTVLSNLGQVLFQGAQATPEQKQITGSEVGYLFNDDSADAMYGYSNQFEDVAMLMQSAMMKYFYNVDSYQIFFNQEAYNQTQKIKLEWGIKNPLLKPDVLARAVFVANRVLPISGSWADALHSIADKSVLLSTSPISSQGYMSKKLNIQSNEFQVFKPISLD